MPGTLSPTAIMQGSISPSLPALPCVRGYSADHDNYGAAPEKTVQGNLFFHPCPLSALNCSGVGCAKTVSLMPLCEADGDKHQPEG